MRKICWICINSFILTICIDNFDMGWEPLTYGSWRFDPQQFACQLSDLLRHLTPATLQSSGVMQASVTTMAATTTSDNQPPLQALHCCPPVINYLQHFLSLPINKWTRYCLQPLPFSCCHPQLLTIKLLFSTVLYLLHFLHFLP